MNRLLARARAKEIKELGHNLRKLPRSRSEAVRGARGATSKSITEEITDEAGALQL